MIDEYPLLAVAAAFASGTSVFHGLGELRVKESDRLAAIADGLQSCGVDGADQRRHAARDRRTQSREAQWRAMATTGSRWPSWCLAWALEGPVNVDRAEMIATSFPGFVEAMRGIGARIEEGA